MIKVMLIMTSFLWMIIFIIIIMVIGFKQNETALLYFGFGVPFLFYYIIVCLRLLSKITVEKEYVIIKNPVFGKIKIKYEDIEYWELHSGAIRGPLHQTLLLKTHQNKKRIIILEDIDYHKFERLHVLLNTNFKAKEKVYKFSWL